MTTNEIVERYSLKEFGYYTDGGKLKVGCDDDELVVYKRPKRVKVIFRAQYVGCTGGDFYSVQFKIENWSGDGVCVHWQERDFGWVSVRVDGVNWQTLSHPYLTIKDTRCPLYIGQDAKGKWSTPVIFNREQKNKLQDLVEYLEEKLNATS